MGIEVCELAIEDGESGGVVGVSGIRAGELGIVAAGEFFY